jgi:putative ABC transport system permease protein
MPFGLVSSAETGGRAGEMTQRVMAGWYLSLWPLGHLALQNLGRRKTRTTLLITAVATSTAIVFTGTVMMRSIEISMAAGFSRLGADLMVVAQNTLTNITAGLLTIEPTDQTLDADLMDRLQIAAIGRTASQRTFRSDQSGFGSPGEIVDLVGFDPERDFTIRPWIVERLNRAMQQGDIILGAARDLPLGSEIVLYGKAFSVYARLGRSGVGTHEQGIFMTSADLVALAPAVRERMGETPPMLDHKKVSGFLIEVAPGATEVQARFALLARLSEIKVVSGDSLLAGIRQGISALLGGALALVVMTFASTALMVGVLFSGIVAERRSEHGMLKAIGARRAQIISLLLTEACLITGVGGAIGVMLGELLLRLLEHSLVYSLTKMGIPFLWLNQTAIFDIAIACAFGAAVTGIIGAFAPAWRTSHKDAYELIHCAE